MKSTFRVLFFLKRDKQKKDGRTPLMCRITVDGKEPVIIKKDTTTNDIKTSVMALFSDVSKLEDLRNKSIKVEYGLTVNAENSAKSPVYTFNFVVEVDPNTYFASIGISGYTELTCTGTADKQCDVIVNLLKPSSTLNETNAFSHLVNTIKNAFNVGTKSVTLNIGSKSKTTFEKTPEKEDINNVLSVAGIKNYNELANEENAISVTFVANTEEGYVFTRDNTQTYTFTIGEFVDTDKIVDKISEVNNKSNVGETFSEASEYNKYYHLSRNDNQLTFDVNLQASGKLYNFKPVVTGFATIIYGESEYSVIKKAENKISKIVIRDNNTKKEYELKTGDETGETLETILASMLGTTSISSNIVSPTMLSNLDFSIKFVIDSTKELIPGLDNYGDYTEGSQSATYDVSFKVNGFNVNDMIKNGFKNASYLTIEDEDVTADDNVYYLKVNLQNVGTSLEEADLFNKLRWYAGLFNNLTITVDETETS